MRYHYLIVMILAICLGVLPDASAQSRKKKKRRPTVDQVEEQVVNPWKENMTADIKMGNLNFNNGVFQLSLKAATGYKFTNALSAGITAKYGLIAVNNTGQANDYNFQNFGFGAYGRAKIMDQFYVQVEYDYNDYPLLNSNGRYASSGREKLWSPYIGGGYMQGFGNWRFGMEIMFIVNDRVRDYENSFVEYYIGAIYNF